jgi:hypothetical protein
MWYIALKPANPPPKTTTLPSLEFLFFIMLLNFRFQGFWRRYRRKRRSDFFFSEGRLNSVWKQADSRYNLRASAGLSAHFFIQIIESNG